MPGLPTGTVTFLFTDIEGSTELLQRLGDRRYAEVLAEHQRLLREAFAEGDVSEKSLASATMPGVGDFKKSKQAFEGPLGTFFPRRSDRSSSTEGPQEQIKEIRVKEQIDAVPDPVEGTGQPAMRISAIDCGPRAALHHQARSCEALVNRRISPGVDPEAALAEIQAIVAAHTRAHPENPATLTLERNLPPAVTPEDHPVITGVCRAIRSVLGETPTIAGMPAPVGISGFLAGSPDPHRAFRLRARQSTPRH